MSFMVYPQKDSCRALMPTPEPHPPGPPSRPMVCHMPKGHEGPHALTRHPGALDRRWEGDARPVAAAEPAPPTDGLREEIAKWLYLHTAPPGRYPGESGRSWLAGDALLAGDAVLALPGIQRLIAAEEAVGRVRELAAMNDDMARQYDEAADAVASPDLIAEAREHAEDCRAIAEGVRRALNG